MVAGITVDGASMDAAVQEAAEKLGIKLPEEESAPSKKEKQPAPEKEVVEEEATEEVGESTEEVVEEKEAAEEATEELEEEAPAEEEAPQTVPLRRFQEVNGRMRQLEKAVQILQAEKQATAPKKEAVTLPNFEEMNEQQKAEWLLKSVGELVESKINARVGPAEEARKQETANADVLATAKKHPDYSVYGTVMVDIANRHPSLGAEEVYQLAVAMNPKKRTEAQKKTAVEIAQKAKAKMTLKKKANVEKRSSAREKISEKTEYKGVRDAGLALAEKLGIK
jgi:hypothetical protein